MRPRMLTGALIGGALVYFLDPQQGPQRRARLRACSATLSALRPGPNGRNPRGAAEKAAVNELRE